jgi:hypothetical protein
VLATLTAKSAEREPSSEEFEKDLLALPTGELVPMFADLAEPAPQVVAQAPAQIWD